MPLEIREIEKINDQVKEAFEKGSYNQAIEILKSIISTNPEYAPAYRDLGAIYMLSQSQGKALDYLKKAIDIDPNDEQNWNILGDFYIKHDLLRDALSAFKASINIDKNNTEVYHRILTIHKKLEEYSDALTIAKYLITKDPTNSAYLWEYAQLLESLGRDDKSLQIYQQLITKNDQDLPIEAISEYSILMKKFGRIGELTHYLQQQIEKYPNDVDRLWLYAVNLNDIGRYDEAENILKKAHSIEPDNLYIISEMGKLYSQKGDTKKSIIFYEKSLNINPKSIDAIYKLGAMHKYHYGDKNFTRINITNTYIDDLSDYDRMILHYATGKAYDDVGELSTAFAHYRSGGILHKHGKETELLPLSNMITSVRETMTKTTFSDPDQKAEMSKKPIFIVGMPRSGTTLMEQVLSSLDGVHGAGELEYSVDALQFIEVNGKQFCKAKYRDGSLGDDYKSRGELYLSMIEAIAPKSSRYIIDKMPNNFIYIGFLHLILPNSTFIHTRRHPIETCLSAYRLPFSNGHYWSDDLKLMGRYYRLYTEMMSLWKSLLPEGTILDIRYEDMINNLEDESKAITKHIGLEWDDSCLEFYNSSNIVKTASHLQIRQPIYTTSTNRWRRYEPYLKPLLDEIGDLVEKYEAED